MEKPIYNSTKKGFDDRNGMSAEVQEFVRSFPGEWVARVYRKIDWRLVPMLALLYLFSHESKSRSPLLVQSLIVPTSIMQKSKACLSHDMLVT